LVGLSRQCHQNEDALSAASVDPEASFSIDPAETPGSERSAHPEADNRNQRSADSFFEVRNQKAEGRSRELRRQRRMVDAAELITACSEYLLDFCLLTSAF
jgi:cysteine synthase